MDKVKTLPDAIRLGATFRPQCFNTLFNKKGNKITASCALGAALAATNSPEDILDYKTKSLNLLSKDIIKNLQERFPELNKVYVYNYKGNELIGLLLNLITLLNDCYKITRKEIADIVEELLAKQ